jgi:hypothetical protein
MNTGLGATGFDETAQYWSSTEMIHESVSRRKEAYAWFMYFGFAQGGDNAKTEPYYFRPMRAFG